MGQAFQNMEREMFLITTSKQYRCVRFVKKKSAFEKNITLNVIIKHATT